MLNFWQQFSGDFVASCAPHVARLCAGARLAELEIDQASTDFLVALGTGNEFSTSDVDLLSSASALERIFVLPNEHAQGLVFFGAQRSDVSATGAGQTPLDALRSCLGEAVERMGHRLSAAVETETHAIPAEQSSLEFPASNWLYWLARQQGCSVDRYSKHIDWVRARSTSSERDVLFPADFVCRTAGDSDIRPAETSGCAAGIDLTSASCAGMLELVERDAVAMWWFGGRDATRLNVQSSDALKLASATTLFRRGSSRPVWFISLSNNFDIPVVAAVSSETDGSGIVVGFSANLQPLQAAVAALKELSQMELGLMIVRMKYQQGGWEGLNDIDRRQLDRASRLTFGNYPELMPEDIGPVLKPTVREPIDEVKEIDRRLSSAGFEAFVVRTQWSTSSVPVVKVVIPEFESANFERCGTRLLQAMRDNAVEPDLAAARPSLV